MCRSSSLFIQCGWRWYCIPDLPWAALISPEWVQPSMAFLTLRLDCGFGELFLAVFFLILSDKHLLVYIVLWSYNALAHGILLFSK